MKVLVVVDALRGENYGTAIDCMNLIKYLKKSNDDVILLCPDVSKRGVINYFDVQRLDSDNLTDCVSLSNSVMMAKANSKSLKELIQTVDVIHIMSPFALGYKVAELASKLGVPLTAGFHIQAESITTQFKMMNVPIANATLYKRFYKHLYRYANAVHYPTEFIKRVFEGTVKRRTNGYIISSGVDDIFKPMEVTRNDKEFINILFVGRFSKEKSHATLIKAVAKSKYKDKIHLYFAGQGSQQEEISQLAKEYGINEPIMKFIPRDELVKVMNMSDLYVHPAAVEVEAISCLEAVSCGLVPIISDSQKSAAAAFAITEKNLFKNNSSDDLAYKIDYWIEHPEEKEELSKQYIEHANKHYSQEKCMEEMRDMLSFYAKEINHNTFTKYYYRDELNDDFAFNKIEVKKQKKPFKYLHNSIFWKCGEVFVYHIIARPIVWVLNKIFYHQTIKNKYLLKKAKNKGYFIYCNHTNGMADAFTPNLLSRKRNFIVVGRETVSIKGIKGIVTMLGAIPIYASLEELEPYNECIKYRINQKKSVTIYPEAHIWPYYTKIRHFKKDSFRYPIDFNKPVFVLTNTWQKRRLSKKPKLVSYLSGPLYHNPELSRQEAMDDLRERVYYEMVKVSNSVKQIEKIHYIKVEK